ncbi:MAG: hypothetical protein IPM97_11170 [Bdellovibrionaceae bacterium]|nr:hypothetical protein [Pseudobdellovibrionaceae bacterium]
MEVGLTLSVFFLICTLIFVFIAIFLPEWVGITGKKAKSIMEEQQDSDPVVKKDP